MSAEFGAWAQAAMQAVNIAILGGIFVKLGQFGAEITGIKSVLDNHTKIANDNGDKIVELQIWQAKAEGAE